MKRITQHQKGYYANQAKKNGHLRFKIPATILVAATAALAAQGRSSSQTPYLIPSSSSVEFTSIHTVGDAVKKNVSLDTTYRMVGIPDGLGVVDNDDSTITLLMDHELNSTVGIVRAHGGKGAFVSKWKIRKSDLNVLRGEDLMKSVYLWDATTSKWLASTSSAFSVQPFLRWRAR